MFVSGVYEGARRDRWPAASGELVRSEQKAQQPGFTDARTEVESHEAGFSTLWELDLFGSVRRRAEAAGAEADAALADLRDAQVLVAAEVARNYLELRGAQKRLAVARTNLDYQRQTLELTRTRLELGRSGELDVASAAARLAATEAEIPPLVAAENAASNRLAVLLGLRPGALAAATARIGVAKADLFPRLSLSGFIGFIAGSASDLGDGGSRAWSLAPVLSWAGFDRGVRARIVAAEARAEGALAAYESAVLRAIEETDSALVGYGEQRRRPVAVVEQANQSRRAAELARIQYREGALDFLRLLDAERSVLQAEDAVARAETELNTAVVLIYKALGGGWEAAPAAL
jgi:multidrug efflux system outer membrane protein